MPSLLVVRLTLCIGILTFHFSDGFKDPFWLLNNFLFLHWLTLFLSCVYPPFPWPVSKKCKRFIKEFLINIYGTNKKHFIMTSWHKASSIWLLLHRSKFPDTGMGTAWKWVWRSADYPRGSIKAQDWKGCCSPWSSIFHLYFQRNTSEYSVLHLLKSQFLLYWANTYEALF